MSKTVIYTAIFGGKDELIEPAFLPADSEFICFTDSNLRSKTWKIVHVEPSSADPVRSAKLYKILPHQFLSEYEYSVWVDGNIQVRGDTNQLIDAFLQKIDVACFSHANSRMDPRNSVYEEADALLEMAKKGKVKDDPALITRQVREYRRRGYPGDNGLIVGMEIIRRHNTPDIIKSMEDWWSEIQRHSRRDQLSFNYVAWKNELNFAYMDGDSRNNSWFLWRPHLT